MDFIIDTLFQIFFIPLLMVWTGYCYINVLKPRFKDINYFVNKNYETTSGKCNSTHASSRGTTPSFVLDKKTYYYNAKANKIYKGKKYKLKYLPNSKYVIKAEFLK